MKAIEILNKEHLLIRKMLTLVEKQIAVIEEKKEIDPTNIDLIIDFFKGYTHRHHHWKEETLFEKLEQKGIKSDIRQLVDSLVKEHDLLKKCIGNLVKFGNQYSTGNKKAINEILKELKIFLNFYPLHVKKESASLFPQIPSYFTSEEQNAIDQEFLEIETNMVHDQYIIIIENFENSLGQ